MKNADHGTKLQGSTKHKKAPEPAAQTGTNPKDAREDEAQLEKNQNELGVGSDHKTVEMEDGSRGTFP